MTAPNAPLPWREGENARAYSARMVQERSDQRTWTYIETLIASRRQAREAARFWMSAYWTVCGLYTVAIIAAVWGWTR